MLLIQFHKTTLVEVPESIIILIIKDISSIFILPLIHVIYSEIKQKKLPDF